MAVPVATPHSALSLTHHRNGESSMDCRIPKAAGRKRVHELAGSSSAAAVWPVEVIAGEEVLVSAMSRGCLLRLGGGWGDESMTNTFQHCPLIAHLVNRNI